MKVNKEELERFAQEKEIKFIILFGSQASKNGGEESDFDIAVLTTRGKNISDFRNYSDILDFLSDSLNIPDYKIDLTNLNKANQFLRYEVVSSGKLLYGNEDEFADYSAFAFREYVDSESLLNLERFLIKKRQRLFKEFLDQIK